MEFIKIAHAFELGSVMDKGGALLSNLMPILFIMVIFYFLLIRPQQKKIKEHKEMVNSLQKGSTVVFGGGLIGTVVKAEDPHFLLIEIATDVKVKARRDSITETIQSDLTKNLVQDKSNVDTSSTKKVKKTPSNI